MQVDLDDAGDEGPYDAGLADSEIRRAGGVDAILGSPADSRLLSKDVPAPSHNAYLAAAGTNAGSSAVSGSGTLINKTGKLSKLKSVTGSVSNMLRKITMRTDSREDDEVFETERHPPEPVPSQLRAPQSQTSFPVAYRTIRADRKSNLRKVVLQGSGALCRGVFDDRDRCGSFANPDDHRNLNVLNYHIPALKRNASSSVQKLSIGNLQCIACERAHAVNLDEPVCVMLSDQNFPASVSTSTGQCMFILRIEDAMLFELHGLLVEFFCDGTGKCLLADGSVVSVQSISHIANRGLTNYTEELVKLVSNMARTCGRGVSVVHGCPIPIGGVVGSGTVRALADLDGWLNSGNLHGKFTLPRTRSVFWRLTGEQAGGSAGSGSGAPSGSGTGAGVGTGGIELVYYLPENLHNPRKVSFCSPPILGGLPDLIRPFDELAEREMCESLIDELNSLLGLSLTADINLKRICADPPTCTDDRVFYLAGASHVRRIADSLRLAGCKVVDFSKPGWVPDKAGVTMLIGQVAGSGIRKNDVLILDPLCNSAFMGTDDLGCPKSSFRGKDGKHHVPGELIVAPLTMAKTKVKLFSDVAGSAAGAMIIVLSPIPRYVTSPCCDSVDHVTNRAEPDFESGIMAAVKKVEDMLGSLDAGPVCVVNPLSIFADDNTVAFSEMSCGGRALWRDPVHLTDEAYASIAEHIQLMVQKSEMSDGAAMKRPRIESVVVRVKEKPVPENPPSCAAVWPANSGWALGSIERAGPRHSLPGPRGFGLYGRSSRGGGRGRGRGRGMNNFVWN